MAYKENALYRSKDGMLCEIVHFTPGNQMVVACYYSDGRYAFCRTLYTDGRQFLRSAGDGDLVAVLDKAPVASFQNGAGGAVRSAVEPLPRIRSIMYANN